MTTILVTKKGKGIRFKTSNIRIMDKGNAGVRGIMLDVGDSLAGIANVKSNDELIIGTKDGVSIRVSVNDIKIQTRGSKGMKLIYLQPGDEVVSITTG